MENFPNKPSLSLEVEVSGSSGDVHMPEFRSKQAHDKRAAGLLI